jgi:hypothetical protein
MREVGYFARMRSTRSVSRSSFPVIMSSIEISSVETRGDMKSKTEKARKVSLEGKKERKGRRTGEDRVEVSRIERQALLLMELLERRIRDLTALARQVLQQPHQQPSRTEGEGEIRRERAGRGEVGVGPGEEFAF